jgi:hypothetical protein
MRRLTFALLTAAGAFAIGWGDTFALAGCMILTAAGIALSTSSAPARDSHFSPPLAPARKLFCRNGRRRADYRKSEV